VVKHWHSESARDGDSAGIRADPLGAVGRGKNGNVKAGRQKSWD